MLQDQDIKGFTLLELMVVVAIVSIVTAIGIPNFNDWRKEREVRVAAEKIAEVLSGINAQAKRGTFPYVQMHIQANINLGTNLKGTIIKGRGMSKTNLTKKLNDGQFPSCDVDLKFKALSWERDPTFEYTLKKIFLHINGTNAACFSGDESYYATTNQINTNDLLTLNNDSTDRYIIVCSGTEKKAKDKGKCPKSSSGDLKRPAYLIEWSRFGNVKKHKWSGSEWIR